MSFQKLNRRQFIKTSALIFVVGATGSGLLSEVFAANKDVPLPAGETEASEAGPVAIALGYKKDALKVDTAKYPQFKSPGRKNERCKSCALYTSVNASWGKCQLINPGLVSSKGWCVSYSPKEKA
jgi:hypothetical protein